MLHMLDDFVRFVVNFVNHIQIAYFSPNCSSNFVGIVGRYSKEYPRELPEVTVFLDTFRLFEEMLRNVEVILQNFAGKKGRPGRKMTPLPVESEMVHVNSPGSPSRSWRASRRTSRSRSP